MEKIKKIPAGKKFPRGDKELKAQLLPERLSAQG